MKDNLRRSLAVSLLLLLAALAPAALAQEEGPSETLVLEVGGMSEESCEEFVEDVLLGDVDGVLAVEADHESDRVTVEFRPGEVTPEKIAGAIDWCPSYDVIGSETHDLDEDLVRRSRRSSCSHDRHDDA